MLKDNDGDNDSDGDNEGDGAVSANSAQGAVGAAVVMLVAATETVNL